MSPAATPSPTRRRRLTAADRRRALVDAALDLFNARAYEEVTPDEIASAAGISRPLLYHYFGGKAGLFVEVARESSQALIERMVEVGVGAIEQDDPAWLERGLAAYLDYVQANPIGFTALIRRGSGPGGELEDILDDAREQICDLLVAGLARWRDLEPPELSPPLLRSLLRAWISMVETMSRDWLRSGQPTRDELQSLLTEFFHAAIHAAATRGLLTE